MKKAIIAGVIVATITSTGWAQRGERLSQQCRREIFQLCGMNVRELKACLKDRSGQLSKGCYAELSGRLMSRMAEQERAATPKLKAEYAALGGSEMSYGSDPMQKLDFYPAAGSGPKPLIIFVHGGGWKRGDKGNATGLDKINHYRKLGYHFASVNYRLVPASTVEQQGADVANAIAYLTRNVDRLDIDRRKIVLMGHSAGAHLSALVGTDPQYLRGAGLGMDVLAGVVPIDGAAYDVAKQMSDGNRIMGETYVQAFGTDIARQRALSPTLQASSPNAPSFLILHINRPDGVRQSAALAEALRKASTKVQLQGFAGEGMEGHREINVKLGDPSYPATSVVDAWLKSI